MQPPWRHAVRSSHALPLAVPAGTGFSSRSLAFSGCVSRREGTELRAEIAGLRSEVKGEIVGLRHEVTEKISALRGEFHTALTSNVRHTYAALSAHFALLLGVAYFFISHVQR